MKMQRKDDFTEVSRKSRVKMHKSGKHWVRTVMSQIGLMRIGGNSEAIIDKLSEKTITLQPSATAVLRGLIAASAAAGGGFITDQIHAEEVVVTSETSGTVLATEDTVVMSDVTTEADSTSQLVSDSTSLSLPTSTSLSDLTSLSVSASSSYSTSLSDSESLSASFSESISESESVSNSESVSESQSISESESASFSESTFSSESTIASENSLSSSTTSELSESSTAESTTSEETPQQVLEQVVSDAEILIQIANGHTTPSQELTDAVAVSTKDIAAAKLILGNTKATAEEIQTVVDSVQNTSQALGALLIKDDEDGIITFALDTPTTLDSTFDTGLVPDSASASLDDSRIVLEQNISEARVLMQMVSRQATSGNETLSSLLTNLSTTVAQSQQLLDTPTATQEVIANQTELLRTDVLILASEYQKASLSDYIFTNLAVTTDSTQAYIDSNGKTQYIYSGTLTGGDASENANNTIIDSISYSYDTGTNRTTWKVDLSPAFATNNQFGIVIATNDSIISREMTYYSDGNLIRNSDYTPYITKSSFDNLVYNNYAINITEWRTIGGGVANNMTWTFVTEGDSKTFYVRTATAIVQSTLEGILKGDGRTLYAQRYDESPLKGIDIDSLDPRPGSQSVSESTSKSESISNSESLSNSESTSNS
ncbi:hypothetical protein EI998_01865, partial [Streptococcus suis]